MNVGTSTKLDIKCLNIGGSIKLEVMCLKAGTSIELEVMHLKTCTSIELKIAHLKVGASIELKVALTSFSHCVVVRCVYVFSLQIFLFASLPCYAHIVCCKVYFPSLPMLA